MDEIKKKIIAIGGVGVSPESDKSLDLFILGQLKKTKNNIGFLGTASKDDNEKIEKFYKKFENSNTELSHFNLTSNVNGFSEWLLSKDLVYVGGGNTSFMLEIWKENKFEQQFKIAYEKGIILSGVSAGAVCWFDWILSDSAGPGYNPLRGINILSGSCTPHSSVPERMSQYQSDIEDNKLPPGIAIDDGVAVLFINGSAKEVCSARDGCDAYFVDKNKKISLNKYIK